MEGVKNMKDLISVVVPVYNTQEYLIDCLNSIINQSYTNLQIILVNDGSTDQSGEICENFKRKDSRIEYIVQKNGGSSAAKNAGISHAEGQYICFVDSDDYVHEQYVQTLYDCLMSNEADLSMCGYIRDGFFDKNMKYQSDYKIYNGKEMMRNYYSFDITFMNIACNKLYKKEFFENEKFPEGIMYDDFVLNAHIMYACQKIAVCNQKLYFYRKTANSITMSVFSEKKLDLLKQIENRMLFFEEIGEEGIYNRFLQEYEVMNLKYYYRCKKNDIPNKSSICCNLKKKYKFYYLSTLKAKENKLLKKIYISLGYIFPFLMGMVTNIIVKD